MHPYLTRNCMRNQPLDYVRSKVSVSDLLIACIVIPLLWMAMILMGDE